MKELKLTLSIDEANLILRALGQRPYNEVFRLVEKIVSQANGQPGNGNGQPVHETLNIPAIQ